MPPPSLRQSSFRLLMHGTPNKPLKASAQSQMEVHSVGQQFVMHLRARGIRRQRSHLQGENGTQIDLADTILGLLDLQRVLNVLQRSIHALLLVEEIALIA